MIMIEVIVLMMVVSLEWGGAEGGARKWVWY